MKIAAGVLSAIAVLLIALIAVFFVGGALNADARVVAISAADEPKAFGSALSVLASGAAPQVFRSETIEDPAQFQLIDLTLALENRGLFAAEWVRAELVPAEADIAVYFEGEEPIDIAARGAGELNLKLVSRVDGDSAREIAVEYYVLGMKRTIRVDC